MNNIVILYFLAILIATFHLNTCLEDENKNDNCTLYPLNGTVLVIDADNFQQKIINSSRPSLLQLFADWCGDCMGFAPTYRNFSRDIFAWKDLVQVAAIDCAADSRNGDVCAEQNVTKFPILKYYPIKHNGIIIPEDNQTIETLRHDLLDRIVLEIKEGRGDHYPNLLYYEKPDIDGLFDGVPEDTKYVIVVVEKPGVYLGAEVIMDLHKVPNVVIRRTLVRKKGIFHEYTLLAVDSKKKMYVIPGEHSTRKELKERIEDFLKQHGITVVDVKPPDNNITENCNTTFVVRQYLKKMGDVNFQKDLEEALRYALLQEVSIIKTITKAKRDALVSFVKVIEKYFPFSYEITYFKWNLTKIISKDPINGDDIKTWVNTMQERPKFTTKRGYLGCLGSTPQFRGYPCTLWKLFHYLTVNANDPDNPREVLQMMLKYVTNFFGCKKCSEHFQENAIKYKMNNVSSLDQSILWLWKVHNEVNKQLAGDVTEDPEYPKIQFSSKLACPSCYNSDSTWNEKEVLRYLKYMYSKYETRYLATDTRLLIEGLKPL